MSAIAALNDAFRRAPERTPSLGRVVFTAGVSNLGVEFSHLALGLVRVFDKFDTGNDPPASTTSAALNCSGASCSGRSTTTISASNTRHRTPAIRPSPRAS